MESKLPGMYYQSMMEPSMLHATFNPNITNLYYPFSLPNEFFRQVSQFIPDVEDYYWISSWGRLYNARSGYLVPFSINHKGYYTYSLQRKREYIDKGAYPKYSVGAHIVVCTCFVGPKPGPDYQVNHKDFNRHNNYYENLEWLTLLENIRYSQQAGNYWNGDMYVNAKYTDVQARAVCEMLQSGVDDYHIISQQIFGCDLNRSIKDFIRSIHIRRHWTHISKDYDFNADSKKRNFVSPTIFHGIFKFMVENPSIAYTAPYKDVMNYIGIDINTLDPATRSRYRSAVSAIRNNPNSQLEIRSQYVLPPDTRKIDSESGNSRNHE